MSKKETAAVKEKKLISFLPEDTRMDLLAKLEDLGIDASNMDDAEILKKIGDVAKEERELRAQESANSAFTTANAYCLRAENLKDKKFALRLFELGVPSIFCEAFTDDDSKLEDQKIWEKVSKSGIVQFKSTDSIFAKRNDRPAR